MTLSPEEKARYRRHLLLPEIGGQGQQALKAARVLVIGAGGLGCPILSYLTAAGVGTIGICDGDVVEVSNLQRQTLYTDKDIGRPKVDCASDQLRQQNPHCTIKAHPEYLTDANAEELIGSYDLAIEGLDRFAPRYVVNAAARQTHTPWISAAIGRFDGQVALFDPRDAESPCYACLVPEAPMDDEAACEREGVLGAVPGIIGAVAAQEAIKWICGVHPTLSGQLIIYDGASTTMRRVTLPRDPNCPVCGVGNS